MHITGNFIEWLPVKEVTLYIVYAGATPTVASEFPEDRIELKRQTETQINISEIPTGLRYVSVRAETLNGPLDSIELDLSTGVVTNNPSNFRMESDPELFFVWDSSQVPIIEYRVYAGLGDGKFRIATSQQTSYPLRLVTTQPPPGDILVFCEVRGVLEDGTETTSSNEIVLRFLNGAYQGQL